MTILINDLTVEDMLMICSILFSCVIGFSTGISLSGVKK